MAMLFAMVLLAAGLMVFAAEPSPARVAARQQIPVLLYHHILPEEQNRLFRENDATVSLEAFTAQMQFLYDNNFHTLTLDELEAFLFEGVPVPPNSVMIQFDDGYYSNFVYAYPVLQHFGFTAQLFFITHLIEDQGDIQQPMDHDCLTWTAAKSIVGTEDVFETASHSHNLHRIAPDGEHTLLYLADYWAVVRDTILSFDFVNHHSAYAYPRGQYNDVVRAGLKRAGITMAFTIQEGYITADSDPMSLERFIIFRETSEERFHDIVMGRRVWFR